MTNKTGVIIIQEALKKACQQPKEAPSWRIIEGLGKRYKRDRTQRDDQRFYEDLRLKCDLEPAAAKIIMQNSSQKRCSINFTQISGYLGEIKTRKRLEPLYDALAEVETSNAIIKTCNEAIDLIDAQTDTFHAWTQNTEYQQFKTVYGKLRNQKIRQSRQTQPQSILNVR